MKAVQEGLRQATIVGEAACFARDLGNAPSNEIYPETLAARTAALKNASSADRFDKNDAKGAQLRHACSKSGLDKSAAIHYHGMHEELKSSDGCARR